MNEVQALVDRIEKLESHVAKLQEQADWAFDGAWLIWTEHQKVLVKAGLADAVDPMPPSLSHLIPLLQGRWYVGQAEKPAQAEPQFTTEGVKYS